MGGRQFTDANARLARIQQINTLLSGGMSDCVRTGCARW